LLLHEANQQYQLRVSPNVPHPQTLTYLRIVYAREWRNFQERLFSQADVKRALEQATRLGSPTAADIREASFLPGMLLSCGS
jgi:hypothetical protein